MALAVGGEAVALVRHGVLGGVEQGVLWQHLQQGLHDLRLALGAGEGVLLVGGEGCVHALHFTAKLAVGV